MPSILELHSLYNEALVRELIEKTKNATVTWSHLGGTQFKATQVQSSPCVDPETSEVTWEFYITKSAVGTASYKYILDVKKNSTSHLNIADGPLPHTSRESATKELYDIVEIVVLQLDAKVKDTIRFIQDLQDSE